MTELTEITPWMLAADPGAGRLADRLRTTAQTEVERSHEWLSPALLRTSTIVRERSRVNEDQVKGPGGDEFLLACI